MTMHEKPLNYAKKMSKIYVCSPQAHNEGLEVA